MRTTGKGVYKWINEQKEVRWPSYGGGLIAYFIYNDVRCAGIISKTWDNKGRLIQTDLAIRPMQSIHDIGNGAGMAVYKTFKKDANQKPNL